MIKINAIEAFMMKTLIDCFLQKLPNDNPSNYAISTYLCSVRLKLLEFELSDDEKRELKQMWGREL